MYFTNGSSRAFEMLMRGKSGFDRYENGGRSTPGAPPFFLCISK